MARHRIGGRRLSRTHVAADILGTDWEFLLGDPPGMWAELQTIHDAGFEFGENAPGETYADKWQHCIEASSLGQKFPKLVVRLDAKYAGELGMVPVIRMWASTGVHGA